MKSFLLVVLLAFTFACSKQTDSRNFAANTQSSSVINGKPVKADNQLAKSVVGFFVKSGEGSDGTWLQWCTGSVLNAKFILTAAHCMQDLDASDVLVNFSLNTVTYDNQMNPSTRIDDIQAKFITRKVKALAIHPQYSGSGEYDLAVVMLEDLVPKTAVPVQFLAEKYLNRKTGTTNLEGTIHQVALLGFGLFQEDPVTETEALRETIVPSRFEKAFVITNQTVGTGGCNGDSGGPAFLNLEGITYQVGVTHGPHGNSSTCHEEGEWFNPALDNGFIIKAQEDLAKKSN